jgi:hypothetical protein
MDTPVRVRVQRVMDAEALQDDEYSFLNATVRYRARSRTDLEFDCARSVLGDAREKHTHVLGMCLPRCMHVGSWVLARS